MSILARLLLGAVVIVAMIAMRILIERIRARDALRRGELSDACLQSACVVRCERTAHGSGDASVSKPHL